MNDSDMNNNTPHIAELLAPVRDEVSLTAALKAGADAVYFGLGHLNMRVNSKGFQPNQLNDIVTRAHHHNAKVYVTLNTIIYDHETDLLNDLLDCCCQAKVDAIICWDIAVIERARQRGLAIHISTQANVSNLDTIRFYHKLGAERIVLARELSLDQIRHIKNNSPVEIEVFAHGALCVSVSGRCFLSQFLYNHSANRGDCHQPCRRAYRVIDTETDDELDISNGYIMSPQDLCTLPILNQIIEAGVDCLKIEGRSRAPEYTAVVISAYRQALDAIHAGTFSQELVEELMANVQKVYNRGFSTGFLFGRPGPTTWADADGNHATRQKEYIGKVTNYFSRSQVAEVKLVRPLHVNDCVQLHGPSTGVEEMTVTQLRSGDTTDCDTVNKGTATFPCAVKVRRNDQLYLMMNKQNS